MPKQTSRVRGVLFIENGLSDLGDVRIVPERKNPDEANFEAEVYAPHHYIKAGIAATEKKKLGIV